MFPPTEGSARTEDCASFLKRANPPRTSERGGIRVSISTSTNMERAPLHFERPSQSNALARTPLLGQHNYFEKHQLRSTWSPEET